MAPTKERPATKTIATNREARHEYFVLEALETGVELKGTEVKSLRAGGVNLKDSWVDIENGELLVKGMHISPYDHGNLFNQDPMRVRRLLAHKSEIRRLHQQCKLQGYTLVPLSLYFKHGRVKMEVESTYAIEPLSTCPAIRLFEAIIIKMMGRRSPASL